MTSRKIHWTLTEGVSAGPPTGVRTLTAEDIHVVFQPIVELATGRAFAYEALVRCRRPEYPTPTDLFDHAVAERACGRLGRLIREVAFRTCGDVALFVNMHAEELSSRWLVQPDDPIGFHPKATYVEVTETAALTHFELCRDGLAELRRRTGALLVVDDFGAGYSNLERVVDLEPAIVKLDLALTRGIHDNRRKQAVVRHVVNLCKELGARVVAEGVEQVGELACVRDLGVDYAQGYLLARPGAPPPAVSWPFGVRAPPPLPKRAASAAAVTKPMHGGFAPPTPAFSFPLPSPKSATVPPPKGSPAQPAKRSSPPSSKRSSPPRRSKPPGSRPSKPAGRR